MTFTDGHRDFRDIECYVQADTGKSAAIIALSTVIDGMAKEDRLHTVHVSPALDRPKSDAFAFGWHLPTTKD